MTSVDRQWVSANLLDKSWDEAEKEFLHHFEAPVIKEKLNKELMSASMKKYETVQQYSDRFTSLMRRTGKSDDDSSLTPVYIRGLDKKLQEMMRVARATHLTIWSEQSTAPKVSVNWEIQSAIALDSARNPENDDHKLLRDTYQNYEGEVPRPRPFKGKCNICGKRGHKAKDHKNSKPHYHSNKAKKEGDAQNGDRVREKSQQAGNDAEEKEPKHRGKSCWTCKKHWRPGHRCSEPPKEHNNLETNDENFDKSFGERVADYVMSNKCNTLKTSSLNKLLIHTPVTIDDIEGMALVDSGADELLISRKIVQESNLRFSPGAGAVKDGTGKTTEEYQGVSHVTVKNGDRVVECNPKVITLPEGRDMVTGLPFFKDFGYKLSGVPYAKAGQREANDEPITPERLVESPVDGLTAADLAPEVEEEVKRNQQIPLSSRCEHPLAVLRVQPKIMEPILRRINFFQPKNAEKVTQKIQQWINDKVIELAPDDCVYCVSLLTVPKKNAHGEKTDLRPCLDLRPLNSRLADLPYPLPKVQEVLDDIGSASG